MAMPATRWCLPRLTTMQTKAKPAKAQAAKAPKASAMPTAQTLPAPAAKAAKPATTVALRGGPAVATVALTGNPYRTGAAHNAAWWQALCAAIASGKGQTAVAPLLATPANPAGVPAHFVGYALRRGYLKAVA